jgi:hypothetical protein
MAKRSNENAQQSRSDYEANEDEHFVSEVKHGMPKASDDELKSRRRLTGYR